MYIRYPRCCCSVILLGLQNVPNEYRLQNLVQLCLIQNDERYYTYLLLGSDKLSDSKKNPPETDIIKILAFVMDDILFCFSMVDIPMLVASFPLHLKKRVPHTHLFLLHTLTYT